jgi:glycosyltransferase involved in cell wall biosynthesis
MRRERIDIIHSHKVGPNVWASLLGRARGVPSIATVHGGGEYLWWYGLTERVVLKLATRVIAVSDYERRRLLRFSIAGNRVVTVPNGIDIARFNHPSRADIRRSLGIPEDVPVVGICAALRPEKNHEMFLEAAGRLIADGSDAWFLVVGGGQRLDLLKEKAAALGIGGRCRFTGAVDDVPDYMSAFDVGVLSSDREGLPLAILEYMASSLPVVATDIAAVSEAVRQDETGFLVPPGDVGALAGAVGRLVADPDLRARLGARGRALCEERFSLEAMMDGVTAQYDSVLENP